MSQPFFIAGLGRSGTTMLYRALDRHPKVALTNEARVADFLVFASSFAGLARGESADFEHAQDRLHGIVAPWEREHFDGFFRERAIEMLEAWYRARFPDREFTHWGDKMPLAPTPLALQSAFPNAKFLVIVRDPRDFFCSLTAYMAREHAKQLDPTMSLDAARQASDWVQVYEGYLKYLNDHFVVRYEDLVRDDGALMQRVQAFLGLEVRDLSAAEDSEYFQGHATSKSPAATVGRWRSDLSKSDLRTIEQRCGELMRRLGYEVPNADAPAPRELGAE